MRLSCLDLECFGHFTDKRFDFPEPVEGRSDFHVIYGPNEAGKTTVMEGFLRLLYGFPHRESYDFLHARPTLRVCGTLQIDSETHRYARISTRKDNLLDADGHPVSEGRLKAALAGLLGDDYRKLFCLDDTTIEDGGHDILQSKGDVGQLLFQAAAGLADLSEVLQAVETRALDLYRKGGSKHAFAGLKRDLDAVNTEIREKDVTSAEHGRLSREHADAVEREREAKERLRALGERKTRLEAILKALPLAAELKELTGELASIAHYPETLEIDPEALVHMLSDRNAHDAEAKRFAGEIEAKTAAHDALVLRPDLIDLTPKVEALAGLYARFDTAEKDLPRRGAEERDHLEDMKRLLTEAGIPADDPVARVPDRPVLADLEQHHAEIARTLVKSETAGAELRAASDESEETRVALERARAKLGDGPDLRAILDRHDADRLVERYRRATQTLTRATADLQEALSQLTLRGRSFEAPPPLPLTLAEAEILAHSIEAAEQALEARDAEVASLTDEVASQRRRRDALVAAEDLVTDEKAAASRHERDRLWLIHLADLARETAEAFGRAMQIDDTHVAARQGQGERLGELREVQATLANVERRQQAAVAEREQARQDHARLADSLRDRTAAIGLGTDIDPRTFVDWIRKAEAAAGAARARDRARIEGQADLDAAARLRDELAAALGEPDATVEALVAMASRSAAERAERRAAVTAAEEAHDKALRALVRRKAAAAEAADAHTASENAWVAAVHAAFGETADEATLREALSCLRDLREVHERLMNVRRQITGMERDTEAFCTELASLVAPYPDLTALPPAEGYVALRDRTAEAVADCEEREKLAEDIEACRQALLIETTSLNRIDSQVALLGGAFDRSIPTGTIGDLREAVATAHKANDLRTRVRRLSREICTLLGAASIDDALADLADRTHDRVPADLDEAERDIADAEAARTEAIENRTSAWNALAAITGDASVATLVAQRQTIELGMEDAILQHLELKLGHMLADRAIRRYRDTHRSGMMEAADSAFSELTNGAYAGLTTTPDKDTEVLIAIQAADNARKPAAALSKGTRFQLYLALRAAAYEHMAESGTILPFFCDDVFETFDDDRTRSACRLMRRIGRTGQAIYLTHHRHVVDIARQVCGQDVTVHEI